MSIFKGIIRRKTLLGRLIALLAALCLLISSCGTEPAPKQEPNLFQAAVTVAEGKLAPKIADFLAAKEEVLAICENADGTILENSNGEDDMITREVVIDGLTYKEILSFYEDQLMTVEYVMRPETKEEFEEISQRLVKEAEAFMPKEMLLNDNGIEAGKGSEALWRDEAGNRVTFGFTNTASKEEQPAVYLQIWQEPSKAL